MTIVVTLFDGETASRTSCRPCTIQGWRPLSVRAQPAVFIRNGSTATQMATRRNHLAVASFLRQSSHAPHSPTSSTTTPP